MTSKQGRKTLDIESNIQSLLNFFEAKFQKILIFKTRGFHSLTRKQKKFFPKIFRTFGTSTYTEYGHIVEQNVNHSFVMSPGGLLLRILGML